MSVQSKTIEETYKKLSQLEHILLRPDSYVGSIEHTTAPMWLWDDDAGKMVHREATYVPGLYKIFDEILVNAADHKQRDPSLDTIKVDIDVENNLISVYNNGMGIPVEVHKKENMYVPEMIFGNLLTSSNYDDQEKKVVGGRNGYGAKLANIFSTKFVLETADKVHGRKYKQVFRDNMSKKEQPVIIDNKRGEEWTKISFQPDLTRFKMTHLDTDVVALMKKRVYDIAGICSGVKVYLNSQRIAVKNFKDYVGLYVADKEGVPLIHDKADRWEVIVSVSEGQLNQVSFVNSIWTMKGGTHVNQVADMVGSKLLDHICKKNKGIKLKPFQIKNHLSLFINCLIENPTFDSQTKEFMNLKPSSFGSKWEMSEEILKKVIKSGIVENILAFAKFKQANELKKTDGGKKGKITGVAKLDDANHAGSRNSSQCTLILTEGDSAKALAISGLSVIGRDYYGVFPLRGKLLNVREANHTQIMDNVEINALKKIIGLQHGKKYDAESVKSLRYGHILIMTDQDHDGSHIKGLLINFFHHFWPSLLQIPGFLQEFITPIVKITKGNWREVFFTLPQYENWRVDQEDFKRYKVKYYKGLGTSTAMEAKEYFSNLDRHLIEFKYQDQQCFDMIDLAFAKQKTNERKAWLAECEPGTYFDHVNDELTYSNFVNKELVLFSLADNARSIPCIMDGLKPSQRKVLFGCFKRKLKSEIKVAQLAGFVSEHAAYHHGEVSLMSTIVGLAQNFVGSNNINTLVPSGQFGTRLQGGKDAASARYIFTKLSKITRTIFPILDDPILNFQEEDGISIEPNWYCPVIPMILVNGAEGIGTGWSTSIPCYNPVDVIDNMKRMLQGETTKEMIPWYRGFTGTVYGVPGASTYDLHGTVHVIDNNTVCITELPPGTWTTPYKEWLQSMIIGTPDSAKGAFIKDYQDQSTENNVKFIVTLGEEELKDSLVNGIHKRFKLSSSVSTTNMVLFDANGRIFRYDSPTDIMREYYIRRLDGYEKRKAYLLKDLEHEMDRLENKVRFILMVVDGKLKVAKRSKDDIVNDLVKLKFTPLEKDGTLADNSNDDSEPGSDEEDQEEAKKKVSAKNNQFDYLLSMPLFSLTLEKVKELCDQRDGKVQEMESMRAKEPKDLWMADLIRLEEELKTLDNEIREDLEISSTKAETGKGKGKGKKGKAYASEFNVDNLLGEDTIIKPPSPRATKQRARKATTVDGNKRPVSVRMKKTSEDSTTTSVQDKMDTGESQVSRKGRNTKKKSSQAEISSVSESEIEESEEEHKEQVTKKNNRKTTKVVHITDSEEEVKKPVVKKNNRKATKVVLTSDSESGSDSDNDYLGMSLTERLAQRMKIAVTKSEKSRGGDHKEVSETSLITKGISSTQIISEDEEEPMEEKPLKKKVTTAMRKPPAGKKAPAPRTTNNNDGRGIANVKSGKITIIEEIEEIHDSEDEIDYDKDDEYKLTVPAQSKKAKVADRTSNTKRSIAAVKKASNTIESSPNTKTPEAKRKKTFQKNVKPSALAYDDEDKNAKSSNNNVVEVVDVEEDRAESPEDSPKITRGKRTTKRISYKASYDLSSDEDDEDEDEDEDGDDFSVKDDDSDSDFE